MQQGLHKPAGHVTGGVRTVIRLEGFALFAIATGLYSVSGGPWWMFFVLLLVPDVTFAAYLLGPRAGAAAYNALHSLVGPIALGAAGFYFTATPLPMQIALIWLAHVGADRALGFGLKYESGFSDTHLGRIGRPSSVPQ
jgi:hypothetical protein